MPGSPNAATAAVVFLALFSSCLASVLFLYVVRATSAAFISNMNFLIPLWAVGLGWLVLDEQLPATIGPALLLVLGGVEFVVDGTAVDFSRTMTYKGLMTSGLPNVVSTFGYINASWTLRADLTAEWVCRVLNHMEEFGFEQATPRIPELLAKTMEKRYWIHDFSAGYMQRMMPKLPRQGTQMPWVNPQNYRKDKKMFRGSAISDGALIFTSRHAEAEPLKQAS